MRTIRVLLLAVICTALLAAVGTAAAEITTWNDLVVALHVDQAGAARIKANWERGLADLNLQDGGIPCVIACGLAFGERGYDLDEVMALADERMYEDKKAKKAAQPEMARKD